MRLQYGSKGRQEAPRRRVTVLKVFPKDGYAVCKDSQFGEIRVSTELASGPIAVLPAIGEQWYVEKISDVWYFDAQTNFQSPAHRKNRDAEPGSATWIAKDTIHIEDKHGAFPNREEFDQVAFEAGGGNRPASPTGLTGSSEAYVSPEGLVKGLATIQWVVSDTPADTTFQVWTKYGEGFWGNETTTESTEAIIRNLESGLTVSFRVR